MLRKNENRIHAAPAVKGLTLIKYRRQRQQSLYIYIFLSLIMKFCITIIIRKKMLSKKKKTYNENKITIIPSCSFKNI